MAANSSIFDKYKAVPIAKIKNRIKEEDKTKSERKQNQYLKVEEGANKFRLFPPHNPDMGNFYMLVVRHWVTNHSDDDSGDSTYRATVLNATVHAGVKVDPIDEYVRFAKDLYGSKTDKESIAKVKALVDFKTGLGRDAGYFCYAIKINGEDREFGLLNFKNQVRNAINDEFLLPDDDDEDDNQLDPFTDPIEGKLLTIFYNPKPTDKKYYKIKIGKSTPLKESELIEFDGATPLMDLFKYTERDFKKAIEGLQIFDNDHEMEIFDDPDWIDQLESIKSQFNFSDTEQEDEERPVKKSAKKIVQEDEEGEEETVIKDDLTSLNRDELKGVIADLIDEDEDAEESLKVKKLMTEDDIRTMIRQYRVTTANKKKVVKKPVVEEDEEEPQPKTTGKVSLAEIKARLAAKK